MPLQTTATEITRTEYSTKKIFKSIVLCLLKTHAMNIILHLWGFLCIRDAECRGDKISECMEISVENWYKCMWF